MGTRFPFKTDSLYFQYNVKDIERAKNFYVKIFGFKAIAIGITHSKKNFDELTWVSFEKELCRKFILKNGHLVGALILGKDIDKKILKAILKKAVFNRTDVNHYKQLLLEENFDVDTILDKIEVES